MHLLSWRTHGVLDYIVGLLLIFSPRLLGFDADGAEARVPVILGGSALIYSALTRYELGLLKLLPFKAHLALDVMSGLFLALSPWLLGFADRVWLPHVLLGLFEIGAVMMTRNAASEAGHPPLGGTPAPH